MRASQGNKSKKPRLGSMSVIKYFDSIYHQFTVLFAFIEIQFKCSLLIILGK